MDLVVRQTPQLSGELEPPPSKLYTQLAAALALLAEGKSTIGHPLRVKDTSALLQAVELMGATVKRSQERWSIWGVGGSPRPSSNVVDARNSATALALMTSVAALVPRITVLTGDAQLRARPMEGLLRALGRLGVSACSTKPDGSPPLVVFGGELKGGKAVLGKGTSTSHLPALLLPCPYARKRVELTFTRTPGSPQLELARELMATAGVEVSATGRKLLVPNSPYRAFDVEVPRELSAAAPFVAAAVLTESEVRLPRAAPTGGRDAVFFEALAKLGARVRKTRGAVVVHGPQRLKGARVDLSAAPELLPILAVLACAARGKTYLYGAGEARFMKSDRISSTARELKRLGAKVVERRDGLLVAGPARLKGREVDGHDDYAITSALVVAGLVAEGETRVKGGAEALQTSYSRFVSTLQGLGADVSYAS
ncbi:MAG: hypothetical protein QXP65_01975 [Candidatus Hadarchaeales archaeon]